MADKLARLRVDHDRRRFFGVCGAATLGASSCLPARAAEDDEASPRRRRFVLREDRFGRLFPDLSPFAAPSEALRAALMEIGKPGGMMDAKDALDRGPVDLIVDPALSANNPNNTAHTAGTTFFGQFLDHDMTFDLSSRLGQPTDPEDSPNERTPALDLDSVYGDGPERDPELYEVARGRDRFDARGARFKLESGGLFEDLPRARNRTAIIADQRNDEHLILAGLHAAFLLFHNKVAELVAARDRRDAPAQVFRTARLLATWHYQWLVLREFLPLIIGQAMVDDILENGRKFFRPNRMFIPVEFQGAAYRFGHSMVRPSYRANLAGDGGKAFFGMIFDPSQEGAADPNDLRGGVRAPRRFVGWQTFFDFGDGEVKPNKQIDTKISTPLFNLPLSAIATPGGPTSLAQRNLLRHVTWQLPSGQAIARHMKVPVLARGDLAELAGLGANLDASTPLWHYVLKEAQVMEKGLRLGPVGARIVGEVFIGALQLDRRSFLAAAPQWQPTLPARSGQVTGEFRMVDLLTFAGVDPKSRGQ
jgi:hypothetical protein